MAVVVCPWCQNEIPLEEGAEPERYCPVCENELGGYRTLTIGGEEGEDEDEAEDDDGFEAELSAFNEDLDWVGDELGFEESLAQLQIEETVEQLLDEQEVAPECPHCREYMVEVGAQVVAADTFLPRVPKSLGQAMLETPFSLTMYVCPSCFAVQHALDERGRASFTRRLSRADN